MESRKIVINSLKNKTIFAREDYKEFYVLCKILLEQKSDNIHLNQPGALHKARWMAKQLYSIKKKNHVFAQPRGSVFNSEEQYLKLREFVVFLVHICSSWWACCASSVDAPVLDINLYKAILSYKSVNESVSESAKKALEHHLCYLTHDMCFSLC